MLLGVQAALAQPVIDQANRQSEEIQRQQQLRQEADKNRALRSKRPPTQLEAPMPATPQGKGTACLNISRTTITGAEHMPASKKAELERLYSGHCLGVEEIQKLLSDITAYYIVAGYSTTRAYLPEQDLSKGVLRIDVVEGKIEDMRLKDGNGADVSGSLFIPYAFPNLEGRVLNLRDIEQGLDQVNRLASNNATMDIAPGSQEGLSIITLRNEPTKRWHVNLSGDNYGTPTTGQYQVGGTASYDNLIGINDFWSFTQRNSVPFGRDSKQSSSTSLLYSVPYGYTTFTAGYNVSDYDSTLVTPTNNRLHLNGDNESLFATIDQVLYRNQDSKLTLSGTLTGKEANNYIAGQLLTVSSRRLTVFDTTLNYSSYALGGSCSASITYSRGLSILGALKDPTNLPEDFPHAQFHKFSATTSWFRPFQVAGQSLSWSTATTAQASFNTLHGSEQISIGGLYTVRGFYEQSLSNDHGIYVRNDLAWNRPLVSVNGMDLAVKPYLALDGGAVAGHADGTDRGKLVGAAGGLTFTMGSASFDIFTGRPLVYPDRFGDPGFHTYSRLSVSF